MFFDQKFSVGLSAVEVKKNRVAVEHFRINSKVVSIRVGSRPRFMLLLCEIIRD